MAIGELKHRIVLQKANKITNENGFETTHYYDYKTVWAKVMRIRGKENFEAATFKNENSVVFHIRPTSDFDETVRIVFQGKVYKITFIDDIKYFNKYIEIKTLEVAVDG